MFALALWSDRSCWTWVLGNIQYQFSFFFISGQTDQTNTNKWAATWQNQKSDCAPSEDSDQPIGIRQVWSESSLCAWWVVKDPRLLHADSEDSDQTERIPRLIWVFAGRTFILLVLSWGGSNVCIPDNFQKANFAVFVFLFFDHN